ncbi:unnamed protein product [Miscanthus lutarioriparius]|uniref:DUF642 domain-containing protein n=1 Tax=Miscanthus lutarioriparius TaxID=422564 RepID=A0A811Q5Z7_9POAL|nr:unnamed protein product [Miscanthus lutarioriparius]
MGRLAMAVPVMLLLLCTTCRLTLGITDGLLPNGNFERGPLPSQLRGTRVVGASAIPSWQTSGFVEYIPSGRKQGDMVLVVPEGAYAAEQLNVSASGQSGLLAMQTMYSSNGWDSYAWAWVADADDDVDVVIHNPGVTEDPPAARSSTPSQSKRSTRLAAPTNLVKNGDFEEGPYIIPGTKWGVLIPSRVVDDHSPLPGWMVESLKAIKYIDGDSFAVPRGRHAVELLAGRESAIAQVIRTVPGRQYALSFTVGDASNSCRGSLMVEAYAGRESTKVAYESAGKGGVKRAVLPFLAASARTRLVFFSSFYSTRSDDLSSLCGPVLDDVAVVSIFLKNYYAVLGWKYIITETKGSLQSLSFICNTEIMQGAEFELDSIKKMSKEYAEAKELALAEASQIVEVEDAKHLLQSDKLLGDKIDEVVKEWDSPNEGFYQRTGLSRGDQLMVIDNDESGVQYYEDGSRGSQFMVIDNDEPGVQNHEDDDFDELDQLLE